MKIKGTYDHKDWYTTVTADDVVLDPKPSQALRNHSPNGFAWGYGGSGPAQLALAILLAAGLPDEQALGLYQRFKTQFLVPLHPQQSFEIDVDIDAWVKEWLPKTAVSNYRKEKE